MPLGLRAATNELSSALQTGLFEEEANRNLPAAIEAYEKVAKQFDQNRALAATAIFRLGEVNRKLGKTNEAAAFYQRILREFADQDTLAKLSQQNLAGMGARPETQRDVQLSPNARLEQRRLLREEIQLVEQELNELKKRISIGAAPPADAIPKERVVLQLRRQLAELMGDEPSPGVSEGASKAPITAVLDEEEAEIRRIQAMIQNSPDLINAPATDGLTPLYRAATAGQLRVARFLLDNGADINLRTVLYGAADKGHRAMVEFLLSRGANVNGFGANGYTALHQAATRGFRSVAEALLANQANVNARKLNQSQSSTPLHLATEAGHPEMTSFLLTKGAEVDALDASGQTPLFDAAIRGHADVLGRLLAAKATPDVVDNAGRTVLSYAAERNHADIVKALLAAKADPNAGKVNLPLHCAIQSRSAGIVEALLQSGADANRVAKVTWSVRFGTSDYANAELSPLALAVSYGQLEVIKLLLAHNADPNVKRVDGVPLIFSALQNAEMTKALLDAGAKPNVDDGIRERRPPLMSTSDPQVISLLLAAGADPEARVNGYTPLMQAVGLSQMAAAEALLKGGASVKAATSGGTTLLHMATGNKNQEMIKLLLDHKADVNARDNQGLTPLDYAEGRNIQANSGRSAMPVPSRLVPPLPGVAESQTKTGLNDVAGLLRQHGGQADLPKLDRIEVTRPDTGYRATAFVVGTNGWNQFTLAEVLAQEWQLLASKRSGPWDRFNNYQPGSLWPGKPLRFPDLARIKIHSPAKGGGVRLTVNADLTIRDEKSDGFRNFALQPGDVVEVPEADHPVEEAWMGLSDPDFKALSTAIARTVTVTISGKSTNLTLSPSLARSVGYLINLTTPSFMLRSVLDESKLIRSSSDLTRVKVTRRESANAQPRVWVVDCSVPDKAPDLWLRDGDVIEVPEK